MIYSTTYVHPADGGGHAGPQVLDAALRRSASALVALLIFLALDYRFLAEHSLFLYGGLVALLLFVLLGGVRRRWARQRWISLGPFNLQPSEFGRIALALILAMYFGENRRGARNYGDLIIAGLFFMRAVPAHRQAAGPRHGGHADPGRVFGIAYLAGLRLRLSRSVALAAVLLAPVAWKFALKDYQKSPDQHVPRPGAGSARRGLPADPGADHRRVRAG